MTHSGLMVGCQHTANNATAGSENNDHALLRVLSQLPLFSVLGIQRVHRKEEGIIGGTNVRVPFRMTQFTGTIQMECHCDVLWTSIPIDRLDWVTYTIVGTNINLKQIRWTGYYDAGGKQMSDSSFAVPRLRSDIAGELSMIGSNRTFIYLAYSYSMESIRNTITGHTWK